MLLRCVYAVICSLALPLLANTQAINLGTAATFGVLGASTVTNTGPSFIQGDLGVSPGSAITGFPPGAYSGTSHIGDAVADQAQADATNAYATASSLPATADLSGQDLAGLTLPAGVYRFSTTALLTGGLVLDAQGDPNALFVFQIGSALLVSSGSTVSVINGAQECNVIWQVGSSATLGPAAQFKGIVLALASVTVQTGANVDGSLIGLTGAVTLDTNQVNVVDTCGTSPTSTVTAPTVTTTTLSQSTTVLITATDSSTVTETETVVVTGSGSVTVSNPESTLNTGTDSPTVSNPESTSVTSLSQTGSATITNTGSTAVVTATDDGFEHYGFDHYGFDQHNVCQFGLDQHTVNQLRELSDPLLNFINHLKLACLLLYQQQHFPDNKHLLYHNHHERLYNMADDLL